MFIIVSYCNKEHVLTGSDTVNNVLCVLLRTGMFVGGIVGFSLDNIIPGLISSLNFVHLVVAYARCNVDQQTS